MNLGEPFTDVLDYFIGRHPDNGCDVAQACLDCPLPVCKHEDMGPYRAWMTRKRDEALVALLERSSSTYEAARRSGWSVRTVHRAAKRVREGVSA